MRPGKRIRTGRNQRDSGPPAGKQSLAALLRPLPRLPGHRSFLSAYCFLAGTGELQKRMCLSRTPAGTLHQAIANNPGIDVPTLAGITGLNENTLRYHLVKLIANGKVTYLVKPGVIRLIRQLQEAQPAGVLHYLWLMLPILQLALSSTLATLQHIQIAGYLVFYRSQYASCNRSKTSGAGRTITSPMKP